MQLKLNLNTYMQKILKSDNTFFFSLTFGSNLNEAAVRKAARPSFKTTANPPTNGEYSISTTYVLASRIGIAANLKCYFNINLNITK